MRHKIFVGQNEKKRSPGRIPVCGASTRLAYSPQNIYNEVIMFISYPYPWWHQ